MTDTGGGYGTGNVGHGVVDCETGGDGAAGGVDVEVYGPFGGVGFEKEELGYDGGGDGFVDGAVEADDAFLIVFGELVISIGQRGSCTMRRREKISSSIVHQRARRLGGFDIFVLRCRQPPPYTISNLDARRNLK